MEILRSIPELSQLSSPLFLAIGVFDGVHLGHQAVISTSAEHARAMNGTPLVVTFDPHPDKILRPDKAPHLLTATPHKIALIRALGVRHLLIIPFDKHFAATEPEDFVQQLVQHSKPLREICVGHEWSFGRNRRGNLRLLEKLGAQFDFNVVGIPRVTVNGGIPTTLKSNCAPSFSSNRRLPRRFLPNDHSCPTQISRSGFECWTNCCTKSSGSVPAKCLSKGMIRRCRTPSARIRAILCGVAVSKCGALSGRSILSGCGSNVTTKGVPFIARACSAEVEMTA